MWKVRDRVDATTHVALELDDIQAGALFERPSPYVGTYLLLAIRDRADGRELVRRPDPRAGRRQDLRLAGLAAAGQHERRRDDEQELPHAAEGRRSTNRRAPQADPGRRVRRRS